MSKPEENILTLKAPAGTLVQVDAKLAAVLEKQGYTQPTAQGKRPKKP